MRKWIMCGILLLLVGSAFSATINVPDDRPTIQAGINTAVDGDTVLVAPGTYTENIDFIGKRIVVSSSAGPDVTVISAANGSMAVVSFVSSEPKGAEISGFTISGSNNSGVFCTGSSPTITNNMITDNASVDENQGAGVELYSTSGAVVWGNTFSLNSAATYGTSIHCQNSVNDTIAYNLMYNNSGFVEVRGINAIAAVFNNTIHAATTVGGIQLRGGGSFDIRNNIVFGASYRGVDVKLSDGSFVIAEYNCTFNNAVDYNFTPGQGNIYEDALFVDTVNADYSLDSSSPSIDAGDPDPFFDDPDGSRNDMGAFPRACCIGYRGDADQSGGFFDVGDIVFLVSYLFQGGPVSTCPTAADVNASGSIDVGDIVFSIEYLFWGSETPPPLCP